MADTADKDIIPTGEDQAKQMMTEVDGLHSQTVEKVAGAYQEATGEKKDPQELTPAHMEGAPSDPLKSKEDVQQFLVKAGENGTAQPQDSSKGEFHEVLQRELSTDPNTWVRTISGRKAFDWLKQKIIRQHPGQVVTLGTKDEQKELNK